MEIYDPQFHGFATLNGVNGAFGGIIALLLWIFLSGGIFIFGACLCAAQAEKCSTPAETTMACRKIMKILSIVLFAVTIAAAQISETTTGPAVGQKVPTFEARDQSGKLQTLSTLRGSKGLVLLFVRSADW